MLNGNSGIPFTMNVAPSGSNGNCNGMGWGDGAWWIIILLIFAWGGFGNGFGYGGGFANGGYGSTSAYEGYVLNNDFSQLSKQISDTYNMTDRKFEGIANGICSLGYDQIAQINGINTNIMQGTNTLQGAIKDCCCQTQQNIKDTQYAIGSNAAEISRGVERGFADTNYNLATQANGITNAIQAGLCQTNFNAQTNTRDIVDSQNAGTQAILSRLDAMETNRLREKLEAERDARYALQGQLDRAQLRTDIVNDVRPCPIPAYPACNPWASCNCNSGCGCA